MPQLTLTKQEQLMKSLLGKLYQVLTGGDDIAIPETNNFIAWCTPGIPFQAEDLEFAQKGLAGKDADETRKLLAQAADFSRLVNLVPDPSGVYDKKQQETTYEQQGTLIWNVYEQVLNQSQVAEDKLDPDQKAKIEKFQKLLRTTKTVKNIVTDEESQVTVDGPVLEAYNQKMSEYLDAATEYNNKRLSALNADNPLVVQDWALNASNYRRRVKVAMDAWISGGYKNEVDQMNAFIDQVTKRDLTLLKAQLQDSFEKAILTDLVSGANFYNTTFIPAGFATGKGWTKFSFSESNTSTYERSETNAWGAEASYGMGLFGIGGSTTGAISSDEKSIDVTDFEMSFDLVQVPISRPWFSPEFLKNSAWRFNPNSGMSDLSNGGKPPKGQLVAFPTTAVFVRNIVVDFKELHDSSSDYSKQINAKANVSYGPFSFGGSYNRSVGEKKFDSKVGAQGLEVPGMQLIALKCSTLPKSPNPSPEITSWS
ncbi:MAG: hypothetical protein AAF383_07060 [Cyanobacteria bacterium P01_A01_bin.83]